MSLRTTDPDDPGAFARFTIAGAAYVFPLSTGITFALTEKAPRRQDSDHLHGLRPCGVARRLGIPVELPLACMHAPNRTFPTSEPATPGDISGPPA